jgi:hypothetical protein
MQVDSWSAKPVQTVNMCFRWEAMMTPPLRMMSSINTACAAAWSECERTLTNYLHTVLPDAVAAVLQGKEGK